MKRFLSLMLVLAMTAALFTGCGNSGSGNSDSDAANNAGKENSEASGTNDGEKVKMVIHLNGLIEDYKLEKAMEEVQKMDKYSNVEFEVHGREADYLTAMPIAVASGEQKDIVVVPNPMYQQQWADKGVILPLDDIMEKDGYDFDEEFGPYADKAINNDETYIVPHNVTKWVLYYNKKIFDDAGVPYPDSKVPMTWDEYQEIAAKLTSGEGSEKIYGAQYLTWGTFWYGEAIMELGGGENFYNAEGLSNIEDPAFANALTRVHDMMYVDKSMPTHADVKTSKTGPQAFMNGQYGMIIQGGWVLPWAMDKENFPRDFELGIAPMPVNEGTTRKTWGVVNGFSVARSSANPELALDICMDLSRLSAKYAMSSPEANVTVDQDMLFTGIAKELGDEGITEEIMLDLFTNTDVEYLTEKITGANNVQYEKVATEEVEKYLVDEQDLDTTIKNIKERGDKAISAK